MEPLGAEAGELARTLRDACELLNRTPKHVMTALSVTGSLDGVPGLARMLLTLGRRLAEEYGLHSLASVQGHTFSMRFSRYARKPDPPTSERNTPERM